MADVNANNTNDDANVRQMQYLENLCGTLNEVLTPEEQRKYCVIFGHNLLGAFDTYEEAETARKTKYCFLQTVLYVPKSTTAQNVEVNFSREERKQMEEMQLKLAMGSLVKSYSA